MATMAPRAIFTLGVLFLISELRETTGIADSKRPDLSRRDYTSAQFEEVSRYLGKCINDPHSDFLPHILEPFTRPQLENKSCDLPEKPVQTLRTIPTAVLSSIHRAVDSEKMFELHDLIYREAMKDAITAKLELDATYAPGVLDPAQVVISMCAIRPHEPCANESQREFMVHGRVVADILKTQSREPLTWAKAAEKINDDIDSLNQVLNSIQIHPQMSETKTGRNKYKMGMFSPRVPEITPESEQQYASYLNRYIAAASKPNGFLIVTSTLQDKIGHPRDQSSLRLKFKYPRRGHLSKEAREEPGEFSFENHPKITAGDIIEAKSEVEKLIASRVEHLNKQKKRMQRLMSDLKESKSLVDDEIEKKMRDELVEIIKSNPTAAGQALVHKLEMAPLICKAINFIESQDQTDRRNQKIIKNALWVTGVGLTMTGLGTSLAPVLIEGLGASTAATLTSMGTMSTFGGITVDLTAAGFTYGQYSQKRDELEILTQSFQTFTGNGDAALFFGQIENEKDSLAAESAFKVANAGLSYSLFRSQRYLSKSGKKDAANVVRTTSMGKKDVSLAKEAVRPFMDSEVSLEITRVPVFGRRVRVGLPDSKSVEGHILFHNSGHFVLRDDQGKMREVVPDQVEFLDGN